MSYTSFRMIAYHVPTVTRVPKQEWESGWDAGKELPSVPRISVPELADDDARIRLKRVAHVVDLAQKEVMSYGKQLDSTLNIFLMPEFYFRPPKLGPRYQMNTYPEEVANKIFLTLNDMFLDDDFKHWLFVCGTVFWNTLTPSGQPLFFNTLVLVWGGSGNRDSMLLVEKQEASWMDGVSSNRSPGLAPGVAPLFQAWSNRRRRVIQRGGLTYGLEICQDHADLDQYRVLRNVLHDWKDHEGGYAPSINLHLLVAGGMTMERGAVIARKQGYFLRNDGMADDPGGSLVQSELQRITGYDPTARTRPGDLYRRYILPNVPGLQVPIPTGRNSFPQELVIYHKVGI